MTDGQSFGLVYIGNVDPTPAMERLLKTAGRAAYLALLEQRLIPLAPAMEYLVFRTHPWI